jgi:hypothetical protein
MEQVSKSINPASAAASSNCKHCTLFVDFCDAMAILAICFVTLSGQENSEAVRARSTETERLVTAVEALRHGS